MPQNGLYRLAESTALEPLVNKWAAWADLISPIPYSLHLLNYQMKTLSSYLDRPELHIQASGNSDLAGGPFVDIPVERAGEVFDFFTSTEREQGENIALAKAVAAFHNYLNREANGQSLESYYAEIPDILRGYVELLYDYYNHPIVRFFEGLLYESPYYRKDLQSLRILQQAHDHARRFFLNTPRLEETDQIDWRISFDSPTVDAFFRLDDVPQPLGHIREMLDLSPDEEPRLLPFLTPEPPWTPERWQGTGVRLRYFGHACVLVEWNGLSILTDPWIGVLSRQRQVERFSYRDLPETIDFALVTHGHHDHFVLESLLRLRHKIKCLVVPRTFGLLYADTSLKLVAQKMGFEHVIEMEGLDSVKLPGGEIIAVPFLGEHADLAHGKVGYVVRAGHEQILFAADSNCLDQRLYEHVRKTLGQIGTVFLGMECVGAPLSWIYGAFLPIKLQHQYDQSRRTRGCDAKASLDLVRAVGAKRLYIYAMGSEPWLQYGMGLGLSENAPQIKEANRVLSMAHEQGMVDAQRLFGQFELHLEDG
jgi:L-ascorbate metabolism protein UlaG (beta-lactamase superfamily)